MSERRRATEAGWLGSEVDPGVVGVPDCDVNDAGDRVEARSVHRVTLVNTTSDPRKFRVTYSSVLNWRHNDLEAWAGGDPQNVFDDITVPGGETWDAAKIKEMDGLDHIREPSAEKFDNHFYLISAYTTVDPFEDDDGDPIVSFTHTAECVT